jgi:glycerophosphoryl diester phosphodiesterase
LRIADCGLKERLVISIRNPQSAIRHMSPLVIAHRGASAAEPENTLRAFELAIRQGAQMIELDLHATRDGQAVVVHDDDLSQTTDLKGRVSELTLEEVRRADAGKGERVPTLEETLDLTRGRARLYLEIKDRQVTAETLRLVRARGSQSEVMIASFDLELMRRLGEEVKDIELGLILGTPSYDPRVRWREAAPWLALQGFHYQVLCMQVAMCFGYLAQRIKRAGKRLYVWTANDERTFARMIARGADGIVTDVPDRLVAYLNTVSG